MNHQPELRESLVKLFFLSQVPPSMSNMTPLNVMGLLKKMDTPLRVMMCVHQYFDSLQKSSEWQIFCDQFMAFIYQKEDFTIDKWAHLPANLTLDLLNIAKSASRNIITSEQSLMLVKLIPRLPTTEQRIECIKLFTNQFSLFSMTR